MKNKFIVDAATLGPLGYIPASGTIATIFSLPIVYLLSRFRLTFYLFSTVIIFVLAFFIVDKALNSFKTKDPSEIVIDELVGILVAFLFVKITLLNLLIGFILFRIFDIFKLAGVSKVEELPGCYGIVLDDVLAGVYACLLLHGIIFLTGL